MPTTKDDLKDHLAHHRQIKISVIGRSSGRTISIPVWFVFEGNKLYLLPVQGSDTQWYKNLLRHREIGISARGVEEEFHSAPVTDPTEVASIRREVQGKIRGKRREEVLFEIRCGGVG